jgi:hypothetical protein
MDYIANIMDILSFIRSNSNMQSSEGDMINTPDTSDDELSDVQYIEQSDVNSAQNLLQENQNSIVGDQDKEINQDKEPEQDKTGKKEINKRKTIPPSLKSKIWLKYCGNTFEAKCVISWCDNTITPFSFEVGHNIPHSKGGTIDIDNLQPICAACNRSMGNRYTITEWAELYGNQNDNQNNDNNNKKNIEIMEEIDNIDNIDNINETEKECEEDCEEESEENCEEEYYEISENDSCTELVRKLKHNAELHSKKIMGKTKN